MTIAAVSSASSLVPPPADTFRQDFGQLVNALSSGNLDAAQSAYTALTQSQSGSGSGPFAQALSQIGDALQAGDLDKAKQALALLQQQMQDAKGVHHHHGGHHRDGDAQSTTSTAAATDATQSPASTNLLDVTA